MIIVGILVAVLVVLYVGVLLFIKVREDSYVFKPRRGPYGPLPADLAPFTERLTLRASDGVSLAAFAVAAARNPAEAPWLLYLHGNGAHLAVPGRLERFRLWRGMGLNVLALDYRGYGESDGEPSEAGLYLDARAAYRWLRETKGIPPHRLVLLGGSLGSTVAVDLATEAELAGLILEGTLISTARVGQDRYPLWPIERVAKNRFDALSKIGRVRCPKLFLHARGDRIIPIHHGRAVFAAATEPKRWVELDGGHDDGHLVSAAAYHEAWTWFLGSIFP